MGLIQLSLAPFQGDLWETLSPGLNEVALLLDARALRTTVTEQLGPLNATNLKRAHALVESGHMLGKVVLAGF